MKQNLLTVLLVLVAWTTTAQMRSGGTVTEAQQRVLEKLERGEAVQEEDLAAMEAASSAKSNKEEAPMRNSYTFDELYDKYAFQEGFTSVHYGAKMMQMMAERVYDEDRELSRLLREIRSIRVLSCATPHAEFEADARAWVDEIATDSLLSHLVEEGQVIDFYLLDGGKWRPSTFLMLSFGAEEQFVLHISGIFSVKDISRLSSIRPR